MIHIPTPPTELDIERFWSRVSRSTNCWIWNYSRNPGGYGRFVVSGVEVRAHQFAWFISNGFIHPPRGAEICHTCDHPPCVRPDHLVMGTKSYNQRDSVIKGRMDRSGMRNGRAKLSWADVRLIRESKETCVVVAAKFGVSFALVSQIRTGRIWRERVAI